MVTMYSEDDFVPISALLHFVFCPRRCALIHLENLWDENQFTAEGRSLHEKTHDSQAESLPGVRITHTLRLHSFRLGLIGQADVVEFNEIPPGEAGGISLPGSKKLWRPFPVEYKRGSPKFSHCDIVQLCAQALCLEEMLNVSIERGALFYGQPRRRKEVEFSSEIRQKTENYAAELHEFMTRGITPPIRYEKRCDNCSLLNQCIPKITGIKKNIKIYLAGALTINEEASE